MHLELAKMGSLGRIYVAKEGINAQISVPTAEFQKFTDYLERNSGLGQVFLNFAVDADKCGFSALHVKVRPEVVASSGLAAESIPIDPAGAKHSW